MLSNPGSAPKVSFATRPPDISAALHPIRVIDTETMLFETDVSKFRGQYATLSHVWSRAGEMNRLQYQKAVTSAQPDPSDPWERPRKCICPEVMAGRQPPPLLYKDAEHGTTCNIRMAYLRSCPAETRLAVARRISNIPSAHLRKMLGAFHATISLGMRYLWADSVCIDSTNMVELAESISCMGDWYRNSPVCLVYLDDETATSSDFLNRGNRAAKSPRWASRVSYFSAYSICPY